MKKTALKISLILLLLAAFAPDCLAAFSMIPQDPATHQFNLVIEPGKEKQSVIVIENLSDQPLSLDLYGADGTQSNQGTFALTTNATAQKHIGLWVSFSQKTIKLDAHQRKEITFTVKVPAKTTPGLYAGGLAAEAGNNNGGKTAQAGNAISITSRIVVKLFVSVPGEKIHKYDWTDFSYIPSGNGTPGTFHLQYKNLGNTIVMADQEIKVSGFPGKDQTFKLPTAMLLQDSNIEIPQKWDNEPFFGYYTATATITFSEYDIASNSKNPGKTETRSISISIPLKTHTFEGEVTIAVIIALILLILAAAIIITRKILFRRKCNPYITQEGDTIASIAETCKVNWKRLAKLNKLKAPYTIKSGQKIMAPLPGQKITTAKRK